MFRFLTCLILLGVITLLAPTPAWSQLPRTGAETGENAAMLPDPLTQEAVREMVSRLSDSEVREMLLQRLDAVAAESATQQSGQGGLIQLAVQAGSGFVDSITSAFVRLPLVWEKQEQAFATFWERIGPDGLEIMLAVMAVAVAAGLVAEFIFRRVTRSWVASSSRSHDPGLRGSVVFLSKRLTQDVLSVLIFVFVAHRTGILFGLSVYGNRPVTHQLGPYIGLVWTNLIVIPRLGAAFSRFILAPSRSDLRLVHTDDGTATLLHNNLIGLFLLIGSVITMVKFNALTGIPMGEVRIGFWLNLCVHLYIVVIAWRAWDGLVIMMRGAAPEVTPGEAWTARAFPWFVIAVSIGTWVLAEILVSFDLFELLSNGPHYKTMLLLISAPALDTLIRGLVNAVVPPMRGQGAVAEAAYRSSKRSYIKIGRVIVFALVFVIIGEIWGLDFQNLAAAGVGVQFAGRLIEIVVILAIGYIIIELVALLINRKLASELTDSNPDAEEEPGGGEGGGTGRSRLSTVLPLVLGITKVVIATVFILIALGNIGIDVTPLLAGAGIVGLAIGFGAQKLVADVVSGIFFLVDDAFRIGEYVEIEGTRGTVEKISVRSMQLRHHTGPVHTIPYGEIPKLTNYSRDWVIMKLKFRVPFDTDPLKVKKIFKRIGAEMMEVPEFAADLLQPFKSQGVFDFDDVGMIIRGKFMAKPGRQFVLRKEIFNRVKKAFEENGIDFARREVRVALPAGVTDTDLNDEQKAVIRGAVVEASREGEQHSGKT